MEKLIVIIDFMSNLVYEKAMDRLPRPDPDQTQTSTSVANQIGMEAERVQNNSLSQIWFMKMKQIENVSLGFGSSRM